MRLIFVLMLVGMAAMAEKKPKEPPRVYANTAKLSVPCSAVWGATLRAYMDRGFGVRAGTSKEAGVMEFEWRKGAATPAWGHVNDIVKEWSVTPTGFFQQYTGFRVDAATVLLIDGAEGCELTAKHAYAGFIRRNGWLVLESNGKMEAELLEVVRGAGATAQQAR